MKKNESHERVKVQSDSTAKQVRVVNGGIEIKRRGKPIRSEATRVGSVYLVIDRSGSMEGKKLVQAKRGTADFAIEALRKGYITGLIAFGSVATHLCAPSADTNVLMESLESLDVRGSTNMTAAIELATEHFRGKTDRRVIVLVTDGAPDNRGKALSAASRAKSEGIDIITIGTDDADQQFLEQLASRTDLATVVRSDQLKEGIASTVELLPLGKPGGGTD